MLCERERETEVQSLQLQSNQSKDHNDKCWLVMPDLLHVVDYGFPAYWWLDNIHLIYHFKTDYTELTQNTETAAVRVSETVCKTWIKISRVKETVFVFFSKYIWEKCEQQNHPSAWALPQSILWVKCSVPSGLQAFLTEWCCCGSLFLLFYHSIRTNISKKTGYTKNESGKQQKTFFGHKSQQHQDVKRKTQVGHSSQRSLLGTSNKS